MPWDFLLPFLCSCTSLHSNFFPPPWKKWTLVQRTYLEALGKGDSALNFLSPLSKLPNLPPKQHAQRPRRWKGVTGYGQVGWGRECGSWWRLFVALAFLGSKGPPSWSHPPEACRLNRLPLPPGCRKILGPPASSSSSCCPITLEKGLSVLPQKAGSLSGTELLSGWFYSAMS